MKLRGSTKPHHRNRDEVFHLVSITLVIVFSLIGWGVQEYRGSKEKSFVVNSGVNTNPPPFIPASKICLNSIDSVGLEELPGFGPVLSGRTVKFRQALKGFVRVDQLKEVYGIDSLLYETVHSWFKIDLDKVEGICVDDTSEKELIRHPYLDYKQARFLARFLKHNEVKDLSQIESLPYISVENWEKLEPYLKICDID